jgi:uncharacterized membrane protein
VSEAINKPTVDEAPFTLRHPGDTASAPTAVPITRCTVTINRPRAEVYRFWSDGDQLRRFVHHMCHLENLGRGEGDRNTAVDDADPTSLITKAVPNELIAWRSHAGSDVTHEGHIEFRDSPAGRGTEVTATVPGERSVGAVGEWMAKLRHRDPFMQTRQNLRRFKQLLETGEVSVAHSPPNPFRTPD